MIQLTVLLKITKNYLLDLSFENIPTEMMGSFKFIFNNSYTSSNLISIITEYLESRF